MAHAGARAPVLLLHSSSGRYGADRQLHLITTGLDQDRFTPLVVLPSEGPLADDLRTDGIEVLTQPLAVVRRELVSARGLASLAARAARDALALTKLLRSRQIALVHSNTSVVLAGAAAARRARVPHVWHVREIYSRWGALWPPYRRLLATAQALPCVSRAAAFQFRPRDAVEVLHDGLAGDPVRLPQAQARAALGLEPGAPVIAVLARISSWKGQDVLVRALAEPELASRGAIGLIAGEAWPGAEHRAAAVRELAGSLGVSERLRLVGFREQLGEVLGATDVVAVPSTAPDPLPGAAIEAAAAGCAVIASAHGGLPEIIEDGRTGRLIPPGDASALARTAAELIDDQGLRRALGAAAAEDVRRRFSAERLHKQIAALYGSLLGGSRA